MITLIVCAIICAFLYVREWRINQTPYRTKMGVACQWAALAVYTLSVYGAIMLGGLGYWW
jgi:hypothetical protein